MSRSLQTLRGAQVVRRKQFQCIADEFWKKAGACEPFPRQLESSILWALPVAVIKLPRLWASDVEAWLADRGIQFHLNVTNRLLHGSLLAYQGRGCILLNGADNDSEIRFSLAHETAHFLLDYQFPRQKAVNIFGETILEVFDGLRAPTVQERIHGILKQIPIGFHLHIMSKGTAGQFSGDDILGIEDNVDLLALEIISPEVEVRRRVARVWGERHGQGCIDVATRILNNEFGLPPDISASYAVYLYPRVQTPSTVKDWLRQR
jgi:hypothetical protein